MQKADPLIRTKLRLPPTRPRLISRPRLQARIAEGLCGPLTLITAPAGFGKTTLAASCIAGCELPAAWLSLDKNDNLAGRFLIYLIAALHGVEDRIGVEAAQLMMGIQPAQPDAVLTSLINDLDTFGKDIVLALDDYQFISSQAVHDAVIFLIEHCPTTFHLLIATRSDPPLSLARLRARGQMVELRAADLRFTEPEAAEFLHKVMGLCLDAGSVTTLEKRTEGWIAGLQMAALSLRDRKDVLASIEGFSGTNRYILDYLLEEVLASQPPEIQQFLIYTSILERLTAPLCDALLAADDKIVSHPDSPLQWQSTSTLEYLEQKNIFLLPLDDERSWYRYHHLFADLLQARLHTAGPYIIRSLHLRAAAWLEEKGYIPEAIHHLLAAQEIGRAADLIERYGPASLAEDNPAILQLADSLPPEMLTTRPKIGIYHAWFLIIQGSIPAAITLLDDLKRQLAGADPDSDQGWMQAIVASALAFLTPAASSPELNPLPDYHAIEQIPTSELILRNTADFLYGMSLARRGELDRAVEIAVNCIEREKALQGTMTIPTVAPFLTRIYLMTGRLNAAAKLCREFLDPIMQSGIRFVYTAGSLKIDLGEVYSEWNHLEQAEKYIRDGLQANEPWRNIMTDGFGMVALTNVLLAKGDYTGATQAAEKFETRLLEYSRPPREFDEDLRTLKVHTQLASGDIKAASHWSDQIGLSEDYALHPEHYRRTLARIRLAQGRYTEVEKLLTGTIPQMTAGSLTSRQLETDLLLAAAFAGQRRLPEAFKMIEKALNLAEPEGYIRIFLDVGGPVRELLTAYMRLPAPDGKLFAEKILGAFCLSSLKDSPAQQPGELIEPLTGRELEVLQLMSLGRTNQEIARQLILSPGTVKAHTASIYRKLDVANRTEAVARARQLAILS